MDIGGTDTTKPPIFVECDKDSDGYDSNDEVCGGTDCDDNNSFINPGAQEICGNAKDDNCNGIVDSDSTDYDVDKDGFLAAGCGGNDCDDSNPGIKPGAVEICGDGIDQDCSGSDTVCPACAVGSQIASRCTCNGSVYASGYCCAGGWSPSACPTCIDIDGDGYGSPASVACPHSELDCNDDDPDINPGSPEICGNAIDENCDGSAPSCPPCNDPDGDGAGDPANPYCTITQLDCNNGNRFIFPTNPNPFCDCLAPIPQGTVEDCTDGYDNDCDGNTDSQDSDCSGTGGDIRFEYHLAQADTQGGYGYVRKVVDINNDGFADIAVGKNVDYPVGRGVGWYEYPSWTLHIIDATFNFRSDDIEAADVDGDGDNDLIVIKDNDGKVKWLENPLPTGNPANGSEWVEHDVGTNNGTIYNKEIVVADFNNDGRIDIATRYEPNWVSIFLQGATPTSWSTLGRWQYKNGKEGMDVGDMDGDGDTDIVLNGFWIRNPYPNGMSTRWSEFDIKRRWYEGQTGAPESWQYNCSKVSVGDIDGDGKQDVVISHSEMRGFPVAWYKNISPAGGESGWVENIIVPSLDFVHNLGVADFDRDGKQDIFAATLLEASSVEGKVFLNGGNGSTWRPISLPNFQGMYSGGLGDIGNDGDIDIVGARDHEPPGVIEIWENVSSALSLDDWTYKEIDGSRGQYVSGSISYFGLAIKDITGDGFNDIVSGRYFYRNPGGNIMNTWTRVTMPENADCVLVLDIDGDQFSDAVCLASTSLYWLEATDVQGNSWVKHPNPIKSGLTITGHQNTQGYATGQIVPGGREEIILALGNGMHYLEVPANPEAGDWPMTKISSSNPGEGLAVGYIDNDNLLDIVANDNTNNIQDVSWWKNPGNGTPYWQKRSIGLSGFQYADRFEIADINGDGDPDVVVSTETYPEQNRGSLAWFEAPPDPLNGSWTRHFVVNDTGESMNSMHVADMDLDGDIDIIVGEVFAPKRHIIFENNGSGSFTSHVIATGYESHLGAMPADLDNDGDMDLVSIAWYGFQYLHLFRNNAR